MDSNTQSCVEQGCIDWLRVWEKGGRGCCDWSELRPLKVEGFSIEWLRFWVELGDIAQKKTTS